MLGRHVSGVIGLGYVGLPLSVAFPEAGEGVVAVDVDERKVAMIAAGESYIEDVPSQRLSGPEAAEMAKLLENIFRSVNIALVNELAMLSERMGVDIWEVVDAAATKPYGFMRFEPGLVWAATAFPSIRSTLPGERGSSNMSTEFIELAGKVNQQMPYYCAERIERALNDVAKPVRGSRIGLLGVS